MTQNFLRYKRQPLTALTVLPVFITSLGLINSYRIVWPAGTPRSVLMPGPGACVAGLLRAEFGARAIILVRFNLEAVKAQSEKAMTAKTGQ
jgi:hypothetical protein